MIVEDVRPQWISGQLAHYAREPANGTPVYRACIRHSHWQSVIFEPEAHDLESKWSISLATLTYITQLTAREATRRLAGMHAKRIAEFVHPVRDHVED